MNIKAHGTIFGLGLAYIVAYHSTSALAPFVLVLAYAAFSALHLPDFENGSFKEIITWLLFSPILIAASATSGLISMAIATGGNFHVAYIALGLGVSGLSGLFLLANLLVYTAFTGTKIAAKFAG